MPPSSTSAKCKEEVKRIGKSTPRPKQRRPEYWKHGPSPWTDLEILPFGLILVDSIDKEMLSLLRSGDHKLPRHPMDRATRSRRVQEQGNRSDSFLASILAENTVAGILALKINATDREEQERRSRFLSRLTDRMHRIDDPKKLLWMVVKAIGEDEQLSRCFFAEIDQESNQAVIFRDFHQGIPSLAGTYSLDQLNFIPIEAMEAGRTVINRNVKRGLRAAPYHETRCQPRGIESFIAIPLLRDNRWAAILWVSSPEPRKWKREDVELLATIAQRVWFAYEKTRLSIALRTSEQKYRSLFESMSEGFILAEIIRDENGQPRDYRLLEANAAFGTLTGFTPEAAVNKTLRELAPNAGREWFDAFDQVVLTGKSSKFQNYAAALQRWFEVFAFCPEPGLIASLFVDITERMQAEDALRKVNEELEERIEERTAALKASEERLRNLSVHLLAAHENERKRIALGIHDSAGQVLSAVKYRMESALLEMEKAGNCTIQEPVKVLVPLIQDCIEDTRRHQMELRPSILDDMGLLATISWFCRQFRATYPAIVIERNIMVDETDVPETLKIIIFRVLEEAMNNVIKHSEADQVQIALQRTENAIVLAVKDNGHGFEVVDASLGQGLGLSSMRERVQFSGGTLSIESALGKGTLVEVVWPKDSLE